MTTDPAAIDLALVLGSGVANSMENYPATCEDGDANAIRLLIAAVEALRERVVELERLDAGTYLQEIEHFTERAESAEAREAALSAAPAKALERARDAGEALARLDQSTVAPAKADAGKEEET